MIDPLSVMAGLVPAIHASLCSAKNVDGRHKAGHDESAFLQTGMTRITKGSTSRRRSGVSAGSRCPVDGQVKLGKVWSARQIKLLDQPALRAGRLWPLRLDPFAVSFEAFGFRDDGTIRAEAATAAFVKEAAGAKLLARSDHPTALDLIEYRSCPFDFRCQIEDGPRLAHTTSFVAELPPDIGELRRP